MHVRRSFSEDWFLQPSPMSRTSAHHPKFCNFLIAFLSRIGQRFRAASDGSRFIFMFGIPSGDLNTIYSVPILGTHKTPLLTPDPPPVPVVMTATTSTPHSILAPGQASDYSKFGLKPCAYINHSE